MCKIQNLQFFYFTFDLTFSVEQTQMNWPCHSNIIQLHFTYTYCNLDVLLSVAEVTSGGLWLTAICWPWLDSASIQATPAIIRGEILILSHTMFAFHWGIFKHIFTAVSTQRNQGRVHAEVSGQYELMSRSPWARSHCPHKENIMRYLWVYNTLSAWVLVSLRAPGALHCTVWHISYFHSFIHTYVAV